jgi:drug/metabolite transporter (DMT)-like permease
MPMSDAARAQWQIHLCVLLWGFTAILGKLISLAALPLVWWRMALVTALLAFAPRMWRALRTMSARRIVAIMGVGVVVALHWLTFYASIKLSNASVAATCMALGSVFTALIEPFAAKRRFAFGEVLLGIAAVPGVVLVVGGVPSGMWTGIAVGVLSAALAALFGSLNKRYVAGADPLSMTFLEMGAGVMMLSLAAPLLAGSVPLFAAPLLVWPDTRDFGYLLLLAIACTLLPFALSLVALKHMSAFNAQLAINLEPVYTVLLAIVLLNEQRELTPMFYLGVALLVACVFAPAAFRSRIATAT